MNPKVKSKSIRIEEFIASQTEYPRRDVIALIAGGKVKRNGNVVKDATLPIDISKDIIVVDGVKLESALDYFYYKFNKPTNVISTLSDPSERRSLRDFMKEVPPQIAPIGRLDRDTDGLMLFTNNGNLAHQLSHPKFHISKTYRVTLDKPITQAIFSRLTTGLFLDDGPVVFEEAELVSDVTVMVKISEGRNRIVRRAFEALGYVVKRLRRMAIGPIQLGDLQEGKFRKLSPGELKQLDQIVKFR
ncbi:rRNA pseudouridine synthase [bacterium]|nr:rRNA pseudouridine synthase [bacterium]